MSCASREILTHISCQGPCSTHEVIVAFYGEDHSATEANNVRIKLMRMARQGAIVRTPEGWRT